MAPPAKKPFFTVQLAIDLAACAAFFAFFYKILQPHVPSDDPAMIRLWGALGASCLTGVFWLAMHMVRVVYRFQRESGR